MYDRRLIAWRTRAAGFCIGAQDSGNTADPAHGCNVIIILIVAWKCEIVGGVAFILAGIAYITFAATSGIPWYLVISWSLTIAVPALLTGVLFLIN